MRSEVVTLNSMLDESKLALPECVVHFRFASDEIWAAKQIFRLTIWRTKPERLDKEAPPLAPLPLEMLALTVNQYHSTPGTHIETTFAMLARIFFVHRISKVQSLTLPFFSRQLIQIHPSHLTITACSSFRNDCQAKAVVRTRRISASIIGDGD